QADRWLANRHRPGQWGALDHARLLLTPVTPVTAMPPHRPPSMRRVTLLIIGRPASLAPRIRKGRWYGQCDVCMFVFPTRRAHLVATAPASWIASRSKWAKS